MKRSMNKILTTHTGSLPRPHNVVDLLIAEEENKGSKTIELENAVTDAIDYVVKKQISAGLDIIND